MRKSEIHGYLYILIGATLWGISSVVAKSLFNIGLPPAELVLVRLTISALTLLLIFIFFDRGRLIISLKGLKKYDPWTLILYGSGFGAIFYWILISPVKIITDGHSFKVWLAFLYIAIFSNLIPYGFYFKGIERICATRASITATWEPVIAGFTAYFALGEVLYPLQVLGGIGVIAALILLQISREKAAPSTPIEIRQKE